MVTDSAGNYAKNIAWNHRSAPNFDCYFISNQNEQARVINLSLRAAGSAVELFDPLTGETRLANWTLQNHRTALTIKLAPNGSVFVVIKRGVSTSSMQNNWAVAKPMQTLAENWNLKFDPSFGGPAKPIVIDRLMDWSKSQEDAVKYYSGTVVYAQIFKWDKVADKTNEVWLDLGKVANLADVYVNGVHCGTAWTFPYRVNISNALKPGDNQIKIEVSNTWANRLIGDHALPKEKQITSVNGEYRLEGKPLLEAGLLGPVKIVQLKY